MMDNLDATRPTLAMESVLHCILYQTSGATFPLPGRKTARGFARPRRCTSTTLNIKMLESLSAGGQGVLAPMVVNRIHSHFEQDQQMEKRSREHSSWGHNPCQRLVTFSEHMASGKNYGDLAIWSISCVKIQFDCD